MFINFLNIDFIINLEAKYYRLKIKQKNHYSGNFSVDRVIGKCEAIKNFRMYFNKIVVSGTFSEWSMSSMISKLEKYFFEISAASLFSKTFLISSLV